MSKPDILLITRDHPFARDASSLGGWVKRSGNSTIVYLQGGDDPDSID